MSGEWNMEREISFCYCSDFEDQLQQKCLRILGKVYVNLNRVFTDLVHADSAKVANKQIISYLKLRCSLFQCKKPPT